MSEKPYFGERTRRGIDLARLAYARSLTPIERLERNRRAAESVILLREAGRRMRAVKPSAEGPTDL
jgi:hypothetical protein